MPAESGSAAHPLRPNLLGQLMRELSTTADLTKVLRLFVENCPRLLRVRGCAAYLQPEMVKEYTGLLMEPDGRELESSRVRSDFLVLAAANPSEHLADKVGRYFYRSGEGLTGWVLKQRKSLILDDVDDVEDLKRHEEIEWAPNHDREESYFQDVATAEMRPFAAFPLLTHDGCTGVVHIFGSLDGKPYAPPVREGFFTLGRLIGRAVATNEVIRRQQRAVESLIGVSAQVGTANNERSARRAMAAVVEQARSIANARSCNLFLLDPYGETARLAATTDPTLEKRRQRSDPARYERGEGLTGRVLETGRPLCVDDVDRFHAEVAAGAHAAPRHLVWPPIDQPDARTPSSDEARKATRFLGVPVMSGPNRTQGVLELTSQGKPFGPRELKLLTEFAKSISLLLGNVRRNKLNHLLTRVAQEYGDGLFQYVVERVPELVRARECSISMTSEDRSRLELRYASNPGLLEDPDATRPRSIDSRDVQGKTEFVARFGRSLLINHYGSDPVDGDRLKGDFDKYSRDSQYLECNLVEMLYDRNGQRVGLARSIRTLAEGAFTDEEVEAFRRFASQTRYGPDGLEQHARSEAVSIPMGRRATSFLATPIKDRQGNVYGVLSLPRTFPGGVFTDEDHAITLAVSSSLAAAIGKNRFLGENLRTLGAINGQINSAIEADEFDAVLRSILHAATTTLGFEFAVINLVSEDGRTIRAAMGMKREDIDAVDPEGWIGAEHPLDPPPGERLDIHGWVLREHGREHIVAGWDDHFDQEIYEKHGHANLIRIFVPIVTENPHKEIGSLEAGHDIRRRSSIDESEVLMLKALAGLAATAITNRKLQDRLVDDEKVKLVADFAHVLRAPGSSIATLLDQMDRKLRLLQPMVSEEGTKDLKRLKTYVELATDSTRSLNAMTLLIAQEVASRGKPQPTGPVDVVGLIRHWTDEFHLRNVAVKRECELEKCELPLTPLETLWFQIILLNLLQNAAKYAPEHSTVRVVSSADPYRFCLRVIDEGPGVPVSERQRIFEPLTRGLHQPLSAGLGMGLFSVKTLADRLEWELELEDAKCGACFRVAVPEGWRKQT